MNAIETTETEMAYVKLLAHVLGKLGVHGNEEFGDPMRADKPTPREVGEVFSSDLKYGMSLGGLSINKGVWVVDEAIERAYRDGGTSSVRLLEVVRSYETRSSEYGA